MTGMDGRRVVITGGASSMGLATAKQQDYKARLARTPADPAELLERWSLPG